MISESLEAVWAVESFRHTWHQFVDDSKSLGAVCAVESLLHPRQQLVGDFWVPRGCFGYQIHKSSVRALRWWFPSPYGLDGLSNPCVRRDISSLMISESLGAVRAVESFLAIKSIGLPWEHFVDHFWVPMGWMGCRIHALPMTALRWLFLSP